MSVRSRLLVFLVSAPLVALVVVGGPLGAGAGMPVPQQHISQLGVVYGTRSFIGKKHRTCIAFPITDFARRA